MNLDATDSSTQDSDGGLLTTAGETIDFVNSPDEWLVAAGLITEADRQEAVANWEETYGESPGGVTDDIEDSAAETDEQLGELPQNIETWWNENTPDNPADAIPWYVYALGLVVVLALLSDYADLAATTLDRA